MARKVIVWVCVCLAFATAVLDLLSYMLTKDFKSMVASGKLSSEFYDSDLDIALREGFTIRPGALIYLSDLNYMEDGYATIHEGAIVSVCHHYGGAKSYAVRIPLIAIPILFLLYPAFVLLCACIRRCYSRTEFGHCERCGYNLTGNVTGICPECGLPWRRTGNGASSKGAQEQ